VPITRIAIREGKSSEYKRALMDEIYEAMRETVAIKDGEAQFYRPAVAAT
jgi:4-oxalocrotonate tautomerase